MDEIKTSQNFRFYTKTIRLLQLKFFLSVHGAHTVGPTFRQTLLPKCLQLTCFCIECLLRKQGVVGFNLEQDLKQGQKRTFSFFKSRGNPRIPPLCFSSHFAILLETSLSTVGCLIHLSRSGFRTQRLFPRYFW